MRDLNKLLAAQPALHEVDFNWQGFEWIDANDSDNSVFAFARHGKKPEDLLIVILNATPVVREGYRIGVPQPGFYEEVLNTDAEWLRRLKRRKSRRSKRLEPALARPSALTLPHAATARRRFPQVAAKLRMIQVYGDPILGIVFGEFARICFARSSMSSAFVGRPLWRSKRA